MTEQTTTERLRDAVSEAGWKWYGYAGHLIVSSDCAYHLATRVGEYLVSTVGDYRPRSGDGERETIGGENDFFETYVFRCHGETPEGDPDNDLEEIDGQRYATSASAELGHYEFCRKYSDPPMTEPAEKKPRRQKADPGECAACERERAEEARTGRAPFHPPHDASRNCKSGGRNHCSCDTCF